MRHFFTFILFFIGILSIKATDITPGIYKVTSYYASNKILSVTNSSLDNSAEINIWSDTGANSQYWQVTQDEKDGYYYLTNLYSDLALYMPGVADATTIVQNTKSTRKNCKWKISGFTDKLFFLTNDAMVSGNGAKLYLEVTSKTDASVVKIGKERATTDNDYYKQLWSFEPVTAQSNDLTEEIRDEIMNKWKAQYYNNNVSYSGARIGDGGWWGDAEMFETILDAYETTGELVYMDMFKRLYFDFISRNGGFWSVEPGKQYYNEYNDDIAWMVIACVRAHLMSGTEAYLTTAKKNFDAMYERALLPSGMLRWKESTESANGTNSCINGPAEVAACYLGLATGDASYYEKAKKLYALQRLYLYEPNTGKVYDSFSWVDGVPSKYNYWSSTYNQGTYLGAALMLYKLTGDELYRNDADKIVDFTYKNLCNKNGVFYNEDSGNDLPGFKGILMRYLRRYIVDLGETDRVEWLQKNAMQAYNNRNSKGIIWTAWLVKTNDDFTSGTHDFKKGAFGPSTAVSVAFNAPLNKNSIIKDAFSRIEAENFNYLKGVSVQKNDNSRNGSTYLTNINDKYWVGYEQVDFGSIGAKSLEFSLAQKNKLEDGISASIEIRLDSVSGKLIGQLELKDLGNYADWISVGCNIEPVTGIRPVYLVFNTPKGIYDLDYFRFFPHTAGIDESVKSDNISIYPTIVGDFVHINLPENALVDIYSITGRLIFSQKMTQGTTPVNTTNLSNGLYVVNVNTNTGVISRKIIKQ